MHFTIQQMHRRLIDMRIFILILFTGLWLSCSTGLEKVSITNEAGTLIEEYMITKDSLKSGLAKVFDSDGKLFETANYENGVLQGIRTIYYPSGKKEIEENYIDGMLEGTYNSYYENGVVKQSTVYKQNEVEGKFDSYYENGQLKESVSYADNQENGPFVEYYENGKKKWEGNYLNGDNEFGLLVQYDSLENVLKKMMCDSLGMCRTIWTPEKGDISPEF